MSCARESRPGPGRRDARILATYICAGTGGEQLEESETIDRDSQGRLFEQKDR